MPAVEKKPVKKEEEIDNGVDEKISTLGNKKKRLSLDIVKTRVTDNKDSKVKKVEPKDENIEDIKLSIENIITKKTEEKKRKRNVVRTVKKVYDLHDPLRIFYESLYEQRPDSEMAALWMMECGLLPTNEAKKVSEMKKKNHLQKKIIMSSPMKSASVTKSVNSTVNKRVTTTITSTKTTTTTSSSVKKKPFPEPKTTPKKSASKKRKLDDRSSSNDGDDDDSDFETINKMKTNKRPK
ncbi:hypothetical protein MKX01_033071 [Papaver californicum]|nr:hypothetical protein MKX01_033071 [Papaver californicum]